MHPLKRAFSLRCVQFATGLLVLGSLCGCTRSRAQPRQVTETCGTLARSMADQESTFVARAQAIREQHILLQDYDRQMIALLTERRKSIESMLLTAASTDEGASGCSGEQLESFFGGRLSRRWSNFKAISMFQTGSSGGSRGSFPPDVG